MAAQKVVTQSTNENLEKWSLVVVIISSYGANTVILPNMSPLPLSLALGFPLLSSPLPWVLRWEHNSRICFAASHRISVDFSAAKPQFSRVDELL